MRHIIALADKLYKIRDGKHILSVRGGRFPDMLHMPVKLQDQRRHECHEDLFIDS
jgi:hypothetical protein